MFLFPNNKNSFYLFMLNKGLISFYCNCSYFVIPSLNDMTNIISSIEKLFSKTGLPNTILICWLAKERKFNGSTRFYERDCFVDHKILPFVLETGTAFTEFLHELSPTKCNDLIWNQKQYKSIIWRNIKHAVCLLWTTTDNLPYFDSFQVHID